MGYVYVDIVVRGLREKQVKALVDTGASYLVLDPGTVKELELTPTPYKVELTQSDRRRVRARIYLSEVEARGERARARRRAGHADAAA